MESSKGALWVGNGLDRQTKRTRLSRIIGNDENQTGTISHNRVHAPSKIAMVVYGWNCGLNFMEEQSDGKTPLSVLPTNKVTVQPESVGVYLEDVVRNIWSAVLPEFRN